MIYRIELKKIPFINYEYFPGIPINPTVVSGEWVYLLDAYPNYTAKYCEVQGRLNLFWLPELKKVNDPKIEQLFNY